MCYSSSERQTQQPVCVLCTVCMYVGLSLSDKQLKTKTHQTGPTWTRSGPATSSTSYGWSWLLAFIATDSPTRDSKLCSTMSTQDAGLIAGVVIRAQACQVPQQRLEGGRNLMDANEVIVFGTKGVTRFLWCFLRSYALFAAEGENCALPLLTSWC